MGEMSKIEEVARAIHPHVFKSHASLYAYCLGNGDSPEEAAATANWAHPLDESFAAAREAIEALRTPTKAMVEAGTEARWQSAVRDANSIREIWNAGIDAALKE